MLRKWLSLTEAQVMQVQKPARMMSQTQLHTRLRQHGFSLIELLVALVIGLLVSIAVFSVLSVNESRKRTTTSVNDIDQSGTYAVYQLDQAIRNAGSGLWTVDQQTQTPTNVAGCLIQAALNGSQVLPVAAFPAPFNTVNGAIRIAPAIILDSAAGAGGDVIITMSGTGGLSEVPTKISAGASNTTNIKVQNIVGFRKNDVALLVGASNQPCIVSQIDNSFSPVEGMSSIPLGGIYYKATINGNTVTDANQWAVNLGQNTQFKMLGVGTNNTLFNFDLLKPSAPTANDANPNVFIENVYQMHALYGVDDDGDINTASITWVTPTGNYAAANLLTGTGVANARLATIKAIKVALVLRTDLVEKTNVSNGTVTAFADTNSPLNITLNDTKYRYRVFESTIPLRNSLL